MSRRSLTAGLIGLAALVTVVLVGSSPATATSGDLVILFDTTLTEDHNGTILIDGDGVTLDCDGHKVMSAGGGGFSIGVDIAAEDVTVMNCHVEGFDWGIHLGAPSGSVIDNVMTGSVRGFQSSASFGKVQNNDAFGNSEMDFATFQTSNTDFVGNTARSETSTNAAFAIGDQSNGNLFKDNRLIGRGEFWLGDSHDNTLEGNLVDGVFNDGFVLANGSSGNTLTGNTSLNNDGSGFRIQEGSNSNTLTDNEAHQNVGHGILDLVGINNVFNSNVCLQNGDGGSAPLGLCDADGSFTDDNGNIFEFSIEWLAASGITKGCNPPANTKFCPNDIVTRGEMAVFLVRALKYSDNGGGNLFVDDDGLFYENSADRLKTATVTLGCNPPDNDKYCGESQVTRGQMAAFLVRAMGYSANGGENLYIDDDGNIFENAIDKLGTAGVTKGCTPPLNDKFCPNDKVTRGQMAEFLKRALG